MTRRDGCLACIRAPPALRPPLGWGWTKVQDPGANARGDERVGVANGEFVGWVEFLRDPTPAITVADVGSREKLDPTYGSGLFDIVSRDYQSRSPRSCADGDDRARLDLTSVDFTSAR